MASELSGSFPYRETLIKADYEWALNNLLTHSFDTAYRFDFAHPHQNASFGLSSAFYNTLRGPTAASPSPLLAELAVGSFPSAAAGKMTVDAAKKFSAQ